MKKLLLLITLLLLLVSCVQEQPISITWAVDAAPNRQRVIARFEKETGIKVNLLPAQLPDILVKIAGGHPPEVIALYNFNEIKIMTEKNAIIDLKDLINKDLVPTNDFWPSLRDYMYWGGKLIGLPENAGVMITFYNKNIIQSYNLPLPKTDWTWDDFLFYTRRLTDRPNKQFGVFDYPLEYLIHQCGGNYFSDDYKKVTLNSKQVSNAITKYNMLVKVNKVTLNKTDIESFGTSTEWRNNPFINGRTVFDINGHWRVMAYRSADFDWDVVRLPKIDNNDSPFFSKIYCIPKGLKPKQQEAAVKFIEFLMQEQNLLNIGLASDGVPSRMSIARDTRIINNPGYPRETKNMLYLHAMESSYNSYPMNPYIDNNEFYNAFRGAVAAYKVEDKQTLQQRMKRVQEIGEGLYFIKK